MVHTSLVKAWSASFSRPSTTGNRRATRAAVRWSAPTPVPAASVKLMPRKRLSMGASVQLTTPSHVASKANWSRVATGAAVGRGAGAVALLSRRKRSMRLTSSRIGIADVEAPARADTGAGPAAGLSVQSAGRQFRRVGDLTGGRGPERTILEQVLPWAARRRWDGDGRFLNGRDATRRVGAGSSPCPMCSRSRGGIAAPARASRAFSHRSAETSVRQSDSDR